MQLLLHLVGTTGVEPVTSCLSSKRSNQLSYAPSSFDKKNYTLTRGNWQDFL